MLGDDVADRNPKLLDQVPPGMGNCSTVAGKDVAMFNKWSMGEYW
jgi:hypothetical protein